MDDGTPVAETVVERLAPTAFLRALVHDARSRPRDASGRRGTRAPASAGWSRSGTGPAWTAGSTEHLEADHVRVGLDLRDPVEDLALRVLGLPPGPAPAERRPGWERQHESGGGPGADGGHALAPWVASQPSRTSGTKGS